jgi:hypothetical protein
LEHVSIFCEPTVSHDRTLISPRKSTVERIKRVGGSVIEGTAEIVDANLLDNDGRYDPRS